MSALTGSPASPSAIPTALTQERLVALCQERQWHYFVDSDGDLGGHWQDARYYFLLRGQDREILVIHGVWNRQLPFEYLDTVRDAIASWHRETIWPTLSHRIGDDGTLEINAHYAVDLEHGVTDAQLADHIDRALSTSSQFFEKLATTVESAH